jgi:hypothetical protein
MPLHKPSRRDLPVMAGAVASDLNPRVTSAQTIRCTPSQILGPFWDVDSTA